MNTSDSEEDLLPGDEDGPPSPRPGGPGHRVRRALLIAVVLLVVLSGGLVGTVYVAAQHFADNVHRVPSVFASLDPARRPPAPTGAARGALTFLLVGTDSRSPDPTTGSDATAPSFVYGAQRSDVIMIVRLSAGYTRAQVISVPRDSWVPVPGHGMAKINAAYSWGGPTLLVQTVEALTDIRIDHFAIIDFAGFQAMTDAVGGIDVDVAAATSNWGVVFHAGVNHLDGAQALVYVRQRYGLPGGDLDREQREQEAFRSVLTKAASLDSMDDLRNFYQFLDAFTKSVSVDDTMTNGDLRSLAFSLSSLRADDVVFMTAPVAGSGREGTQSVVHLDVVHGAELWRAVTDDDVDQYLKENPSTMLGVSTR